MIYSKYRYRMFFPVLATVLLFSCGCAGRIDRDGRKDDAGAFDRFPVAALSMGSVESLDNVSVLLESYMEKNELPVKATLEIDNRKITEKKLRIGPMERKTLSYQLPFIMTDKHLIKVSVDFATPRNLTPWEEWLDFGRMEVSSVYDPGTFQKIHYAGFEPRIDGNLSEWQHIPAITLEKEGGISADIRLAWDEKNFYLAAEVEDGKHVNERTGRNIWNGDAMQFAFVPLLDKAEVSNLALALASNRVQLHAFQSPDEKLVEKSEYTVVRDNIGEKTFYEIMIPFRCLGINSRKGTVFAFNTVVFEAKDAMRYDYWIEITPGLAGGWNSDKFKRFVLWK